jgi:RNA polymerase sigma-70 factor (ECF subfamily)
MSSADDATDRLLRLAAQGDPDAFDQLVAGQRQRLKQVVAVRLDARLKPRVDPSDVIQETLVEAARRFSDYLRTRPLPFYPWLRQIALDQIVRVHRRHVRAERRSVRQETALAPLLSDESIQQLAGRLRSRGSAPDRRLLRSEARGQVRAALDRLSADDREVLVLRYLEQLTGPEVAAILGISPGALRMRQLRALERLQDLITTAFDSEN